MRLLAFLYITLQLLGAYAYGACIPLGGNCANTNSVCCAPNLYSDPAKHTGCHCVSPTTTTTSSTPTTTGSVTTTTVVVPIANDFSFMYSPADLGALLITESCQYTGDLMDPRTAFPANQLLLATMGWQFEEYSMEAVALADAVGCPFNSVQIEDANFKFGADYVLDHQAFPTGGTYTWMQPTYVRQYTCAPIVAIAQCLQAKGVLPPDLAQVAGLIPGPISPPPQTLDTGVNDGLLHYTPGYYPPLTPPQCAALQAADDAHMAHDQALLAHDYDLANANNAAVTATQRAFEATAANIGEATLFKWQWQAYYNFGNPIEVLDGLTAQIIADHHAATTAYNCATGASPDVAAITHYELKHNLHHDCRATTHWLDKPMPTVCQTTQPQSCPRMTCRAQATTVVP